MAGSDRLIQPQPDATRLWIGVRGARDCREVGLHLLAERDVDHDLALVVGEMGVHLGAGRVADDERVLGYAKVIIWPESPLIVQRDADVFQPQTLEVGRTA